MLLHTAQEPWQLLNHAAVNVADALTASVNTYALAYSGTWATSAQNPANRPASARRIGLDANIMRFRFLVADTSNDQVASTIWMWDINGAPMNSLVINPVQAGASICNAAPFENGYGLHILPFDSGGTTPVTSGMILTLGVTATTFIVEKVALTSGAWTAGTAAGYFYGTGSSETFTDNAALNIGATDMATVNTPASTGTVDTLRHFFYADTLTITSDHAGSSTWGTAGADGILELQCDWRGGSFIFADFDCDAGSGTDGVDAICMYKYL